jgi:hypothetical protein
MEKSYTLTGLVLEPTAPFDFDSCLGAEYRNKRISDIMNFSDIRYDVSEETDPQYAGGVYDISGETLYIEWDSYRGDGNFVSAVSKSQNGTALYTNNALDENGIFGVWFTAETDYIVVSVEESGSTVDYKFTCTNVTMG